MGINLKWSYKKCPLCKCKLRKNINFKRVYCPTSISLNSHYVINYQFDSKLYLTTKNINSIKIIFNNDLLFETTLIPFQQTIMKTSNNEIKKFDSAISLDEMKRYARGWCMK